VKTVTVLVTVLGAVLALLWGLPFAAVILTGYLVVGVMARPPELTGPKADGRPTPADERETRLLQQFRARRESLASLGNPAAWLMSGQPTVVLLVGVLTGGVAACVPQAWWWSHLVNLVAVLVLVIGEGCRRRVMLAATTPPPPVTLRQAVSTVTGKRVPGMVAVGLSIGLLVAVVGWLAGTNMVGRLRDQTLDWVSGWATMGMLLPSGPPWWAACLLSVVLGAVAGWWVGAKPVLREDWTRQNRVVTDWKPVWEALKLGATPTVRRVTLVKAGEVSCVKTVFEVPAHIGADVILNQAGTVREKRGDLGSTVIGILPAEAIDPVTGQPIPGQQSTSLFMVVEWTDGLPELTGLTVEAASLAFQTVMQSAAEKPFTPVLMREAKALNDDASAWMVETWLGNETFETLSGDMAGRVSGMFGCEVLVDAYPETPDGRLPARLFAGDLTVNPETVEVPLGHGGDGYFEDLRAEEDWVRAWTSATGSSNFPIVSHRDRKQADLVLGWRYDEPSRTVTVEKQPFRVRLAVDVEKTLLPVEAKLGTHFQDRPMLYLGWYNSPKIMQAGVRSTNTIQVLSSKQRIPTMDQIPPQPVVAPMFGQGVKHQDDAALWVAAWWVAKAFTAAKLARPEVCAAVCLTERGSTQHVWMFTIRLYGGVQLTDVIRKTQALRDGMGGVAWLRVTSDQSGDCVIMAGGNPIPAGTETTRVLDGTWQIVDRGRPRMVMTEQNHRVVLGVVWSGWWGDTKCQTHDGARPRLLTALPLPDNPLVEETLHELPSGLTVDMVRAARKAIGTASGNRFVAVHSGDTASQVRLLTAVEDPMPAVVPYDFDEPVTLGRVLMGVGVDGLPLGMDFDTMAHVLLSGTTGSGKSWSITAPIISALRAGCQLVFVDPEKKAQDFQFLAPWMTGLAVTHEDAAALLKAMLAEADRRQALCVEHGVGHIDRLPDSVRPPHVLIMVDELSELLKTGVKPDVKPHPVPAMEEERQRAWVVYSAKMEIAAALGRFGRVGRSSGVHVFAATQTMKAADLPATMNDFKNNTNRALLGAASYAERAIALTKPDSDPDPGEIVPLGRGVWEPRMGRAQLVQFWGTPPDVYRDWLDGHIPPVVERVDYSGFVTGVGEFSAFTVVDEAAFQVVDTASQELEASAEVMDWGDFDWGSASMEEEPANPVVGSASEWGAPTPEETSPGDEPLSVEVDVWGSPLPVAVTPVEPSPPPPPTTASPPKVKPLSMGDPFSSFRSVVRALPPATRR
jgi:hypothetical protein